MKLLSFGVVAGAALLGLGILLGVKAPPANAGAFVDFSCSSGSATTPCVSGAITGVVSKSGTTTYSSSGIAVWNGAQFSLASPFDFTFSTNGTAAGTTATITGTGAWAGYNFTATSFGSLNIITSSTETTIVMANSTWVLSPLAATKFNGGQAIDTGSVGFPTIKVLVGTSVANSVDVGLAVTPEPSALVLFGPGALGLLGLVVQRRRWHA